MAKKNGLARDRGYEKLCTDLLAIIERGRRQAERALAGIRNETYWKMGRRLGRERRMQDAGSAAALLRELAADLGMDRSRLYRALKFYQTYPEGLPDDETVKLLSWTAHTALLPIKDPDERAYYLGRAAERGWSARALRRAIKAGLYHVETGDAEGSVPRTESRMHNYTVEVERVIDGDTLDVLVDLGFRSWRRETIRLRGIDTPELDSEEGRSARAFVISCLEGAACVVVRTYKTDSFARYVGDLFYHPEATDQDEVLNQGHFLNQQLLDAGLARVWVR